MFCYTYDIWFDNNYIVECSNYPLDTLIELIKENGVSIQETTIWGSVNKASVNDIPHTYNDFCNSDYSIIIDCYDFEYVAVFCKDRAFLDEITKSLTSPSVTVERIMNADIAQELRF